MEISSDWFSAEVNIARLHRVVDCHTSFLHSASPRSATRDYEPDFVAAKQTRAGMLSRLSTITRNLTHLPAPRTGNTRTLICFNQLCPVTLPTNSIGKG